MKQEIKYSKFQSWFIKFCEEKQIDMADFVTCGDGSTLAVGDVCTAIMNAPQAEQTQIQLMFVKIDFKNGDVMDYIKHLAKALTSKDKVVGA